ncbi:tetratricopeptide repeat protein [Pseudidiomarina marina]|uniref:Uncharacterized protein n=1 Tax=Pseudidiomarina marina TaxID=502366 RepID=A0A432YFU8_9GAMM|nr:tetratricopeptide repeat protein [Pseudidiomarina marina]RUO59827.1 hypothetical protein CWI76_06765 [Pseudidiomarina marina]
MSVINRMLRDLDQRQQQNNRRTYTPAAVAPQPIHWAWIVGILVVSLAAIIGALNLWWMYSSNQASAEVESASTVETTPVELSQSIAKSEALAAETVGKETPTKSETSSQEAAAKVEKPNVIVDVATLPKTQDTEVTEKSPKQPTTESEPAETNVITEPAPTPEPTPKATKKPPASSSSQSFSVERVQLSSQELADTNLAKAREAFQKGEQARGQELLEKALVVKPDHVKVRSELAAYWYGRGLTSRAITLLQQGLDLKPQQTEWQLLLARIYERVGRVEQAYQVLAVIPMQAPETPELLQLRASSATQLGYFNEAAADYTALATQSNEGRWWLAAAVAYEDGDNIEAAVRSYHQAIKQPDLGQDARSYIEQRLAVLEGF